MSTRDFDWNAVVWKKPTPKTAPTTATGLAQAKAAGTVETVKRSTHNVALKRLDDHDQDVLRHKVVSGDFSRALVNARLAKGWKRADLARQVNKPERYIADYETGKAIRDGAFVNVLNRTLGVALPKV
jgi:putative transcription factor